MRLKPIYPFSALVSTAAFASFTLFSSACSSNGQLPPVDAKQAPASAACWTPSPTNPLPLLNAVIEGTPPYDACLAGDQLEKSFYKPIEKGWSVAKFVRKEASLSKEELQQLQKEAEAFREYMGALLKAINGELADLTNLFQKNPAIANCKLYGLLKRTCGIPGAPPPPHWLAVGVWWEVAKLLSFFKSDSSILSNEIEAAAATVMVYLQNPCIKLNSAVDKDGRYPIMLVMLGRFIYEAPRPARQQVIQTLLSHPNFDPMAPTQYHLLHDVLGDPVDNQGAAGRKCEVVEALLRKGYDPVSGYPRSNGPQKKCLANPYPQPKVVCKKTFTKEAVRLLPLFEALLAEKDVVFSSAEAQASTCLLRNGAWPLLAPVVQHLNLPQETEVARNLIRSVVAVLPTYIYYTAVPYLTAYIARECGMPKPLPTEISQLIRYYTDCYYYAQLAPQDHQAIRSLMVKWEAGYRQNASAPKKVEKRLRLQHFSRSAGLLSRQNALGCTASGCLNTSAKWRCSKCKLVRYCGERCQRAHWKAGHKETCPQYLDSTEVLPLLPRQL